MMPQPAPSAPLDESALLSVAFDSNIKDPPRLGKHYFTNSYPFSSNRYAAIRTLVPNVDVTFHFQCNNGTWRVTNTDAGECALWTALQMAGAVDNDESYPWIFAFGSKRVCWSVEDPVPL